MSFHRLNSYEISLDRLFQEISSLDDDDINKAHLTRYLCVRTSGFLEVVIRNLISNLSDGTSPQPIQSYVQSKTKYITNLSYVKMRDLLAEFDANWCETFVDKISDQQKAALNSVVANRNNISHGNPDNTSFRDMKQYYSDIKEVVKILKGIIKK
ncbi:HEPN domain-containing protein [Pedobacter xixiisoli]|uniref:RiboL-PSP-HEPN domain-containing protein n=1 Tax=Pedobacter xixiisoli TaxID=1476464 RepID=A0A285ZZR3_9SPHI|nr:HEPN domain-containing protein [Pedobacter xixiisoli]SOD15137.1 hypothetical protein SAMN06297358_2112 [Pedobacter xixiisoli]